MVFIVQSALTRGIHAPSLKNVEKFYFWGNQKMNFLPKEVNPSVWALSIQWFLKRMLNLKSMGTIKYGGNFMEFGAPIIIQENWSERQSKTILKKAKKVQVHLTPIVKSWKTHPEFFLKFSFSGSWARPYYWKTHPDLVEFSSK